MYVALSFNTNVHVLREFRGSFPRDKPTQTKCCLILRDSKESTYMRELSTACINADHASTTWWLKYFLVHLLAQYIARIPFCRAPYLSAAILRCLNIWAIILKRYSEPIFPRHQ